MVEQTIETPVIRDAMTLNWPHCNVTSFSQVMDANSQSGTAMPTWCPGQLRTAFRRFQERSDETRSLNTGTCPYILYLPIICTRGVAVLKSCVHIFPEDTWRNDNVIITSQQRCYVFFYVIMTLSLRHTRWVGKRWKMSANNQISPCSGFLFWKFNIKTYLYFHTFLKTKKAQLVEKQS